MPTRFIIQRIDDAEWDGFDVDSSDSHIHGFLSSGHSNAEDVPMYSAADSGID